MVEMWETSAPGAFLTITAPRGVVSVWAAGDQRHRVVADGDVVEDRLVVGFAAARDLAHVLARRMGATR